MAAGRDHHEQQLREPCRVLSVAAEHPVSTAPAPGFGLGLPAGVLCGLAKAEWGTSNQLTNLYGVKFCTVLAEKWP